MFTALKKKYNLSNYLEKKNFAEEALKDINRLKDANDKNHYLNELKNLTGLSFSDSTKPKDETKELTKYEPTITIKDGLYEVEESILAMMLNSEEAINDNELLKHLKKYLYKQEAIYQYLCNKIFKKELFDDIYFPDDMIGEDFIVITQILDKINNIKLINYTAYYYDLTNESQSKEKYSIKHKNMFYEFKKYYEDSKDKEYNLELKNYIYKHYLAILVSMSKSNDYPLDLEEEIIKFIKDNKDDYLRYSNDNITFKIATRLLCRNKNLFYKISRYLYKYL